LSIGPPDHKLLPVALRLTHRPLPVTYSLANMFSAKLATLVTVFAGLASGMDPLSPSCSS